MGEDRGGRWGSAAESVTVLLEYGAGKSQCRLLLSFCIDSRLSLSAASTLGPNTGGRFLRTLTRPCRTHATDAYCTGSPMSVG